MMMKSMVALALLLLASSASAVRVASDHSSSSAAKQMQASREVVDVDARSATMRRAAKFQHLKAARRVADDQGEDAQVPYSDARLEANFQDIKRRLLQLEAHDNWQLRREGILPASAAEDQRLHELLQGVDPSSFCTSKEYRRTMMKLLKDAPFIGLFNDLRNLTRFEGSSITYAKGAYWVVFDSLRTIGKIGLQFQFRGAENKLVPEDADEVESQFEGLQYMPSTDSFLAVRESVEHEFHGLVPLTEEIKLSEDGTQWTVMDVCPVMFFGLEDVNKGWEGLHYFEKDGGRFLLGLCESNFCKTILGPTPPGLQRGNGRLVLSQYVKGMNPHPHDQDECHWQVLRTIRLPREAYFLDYAGIAFWPHPFGEQVSIVSQEDSAVYLGKFDWDNMEFLPGGKVYHFPRDDDCRKIFCNVEGLTFLDSRRLLFASDRSKPTQSFECMGRDQSVHIMALP